METSKTLIACIADDELIRVVDELKKTRKTKNTSQIVREALFAYLDFFAKSYPNMDNQTKNQKRQESKE